MESTHASSFIVCGKETVGRPNSFSRWTSRGRNAKRRPSRIRGYRLDTLKTQERELDKKEEEESREKEKDLQRKKEELSDHLVRTHAGSGLGTSEHRIDFDLWRNEMDRESGRASGRSPCDSWTPVPFTKGCVDTKYVAKELRRWRDITKTVLLSNKDPTGRRTFTGTKRTHDGCCSCRFVPSGLDRPSRLYRVSVCFRFVFAISTLLWGSLRCRVRGFDFGSAARNE